MPPLRTALVPDEKRYSAIEPLKFLGLADREAARCDESLMISPHSSRAA